MALNNILLLSQIAGYVIALILSLCVFIPMVMHHEEFNGKCLLFSTGEWQESDGQFNVNWASQAYCNYNVILGLILFLVCIIQIYRLSLLAYRDQDSSFLSTFVNVVICINLAGMTVIGAIMITLGFMTWCQNMTQRFPSCEVAAGRDIDKKDSINTSGFYIEIGVAQVGKLIINSHISVLSYILSLVIFLHTVLNFGAWGSFACWVGLGVFALVKLCRHHQLENIRVSMYNERQRLVNEMASATSSPVTTLERNSEGQQQSKPDNTSRDDNILID